jgi:hypothetical protein
VFKPETSKEGKKQAKQIEEEKQGEEANVGSVIVEEMLFEGNKEFEAVKQDDGQGHKDSERDKD